MNSLSKALVFPLLVIPLLLALPARGKERLHEVKPGDSVAKIANFYGVSQRDLKAANGIGQGAVIDVGDMLVIPEALRNNAGKSHTVKAGDTLAGIAKKYKVSIKALGRANRIGKKGRLKIGRVLVIPGTEGEGTAPPPTPKPVEGGKLVKGGVLHTVQSGQSLWTIARAYNTSTDRIVKRNALSTEEPLKVGQELLIPGVKGVISAKSQRGGSLVRFVRVHNNKRARLRLLNRKGRVIPKSRLALSKLARDRRGRHRFRLLHPRLVQNLQRVADQFPGETIVIVSGYRSPRKGHRRSKHGLGHALDFRVTNVPNKTLYEYIKSLPRVGAGYYPNSVFVHMDVRDRSYTWTDLAGPGEAARYVKPGEETDIEAAADVASDDELALPEDSTEGEGQ